MSHKYVWIEIATQWLEFGVVTRERVESMHRVVIDSTDRARPAREDGPAVPPNLSHHIGHGLSMLGVARAGVNVIWHGSGSCVDVHTIGAPPGPAVAAAALAFSMANAIDQGTWATNSRVIATRKTSPDAPESAVLVAAVHHRILREIEQGVEEAGCTLRTVIPAPSIGLLLASQGALDSSHQSTDPIICLHVDEEAAAIAIAVDGALMLARTIELGYATLRHAYMRATRSQHPSHAEAFLAAHKRLLETDGIPSPKNGDSIEIFEYVRPYLQRLFIEIKQTVRFTLDEDQLERARVRLVGPGAAIPRLGAMLAEEIGFESVEAPPERQHASDPGFGIADGVRASAATFGVQPPGRVERRERSSRRAALVYGAAGAALLLAGAASLSFERAVGSVQTARTLDRELRAWREQSEAGRGMNPKVLAESLDTLIQADSALRADWGAALAEIVMTRPDGVRLSGLSGLRDLDGSHVQLDALAPADADDADPHAQISSFVETLQDSPLIADTHLGTSEQVEMGDRRFLRFSLTVDLIETRAPWLTAEAPQ